MGGKRLHKGQGEDLGGTTIRSRFDAMEQARSVEFQKSVRRGSEPKADPGISGSKVANPRHSVGAGFEVYNEKFGGRKGTRGKRSTM